MPAHAPRQDVRKEDDFTLMCRSPRADGPPADEHIPTHGFITTLYLTDIPTQQPLFVLFLILFPTQYPTDTFRPNRCSTGVQASMINPNGCHRTSNEGNCCAARFLTGNRADVPGDCAHPQPCRTARAHAILRHLDGSDVAEGVHEPCCAPAAPWRAGMCSCRTGRADQHGD